MKCFFAKSILGLCFTVSPTRRLEVRFTDELRNKVETVTKEMHKFADRGQTPKAKLGKFCKECSLNNECVPNISKTQSVKNYIKEHLQEEG